MMMRRMMMRRMMMRRRMRMTGNIPPSSWNSTFYTQLLPAPSSCLLHNLPPRPLLLTKVPNISDFRPSPWVYKQRKMSEWKSERERGERRWEKNIFSQQFGNFDQFHASKNVLSSRGQWSWHATNKLILLARFSLIFALKLVFSMQLNPNERPSLQPSASAEKNRKWERSSKWMSGGNKNDENETCGRRERRGTDARAEERKNILREKEGDKKGCKWHDFMSWADVSCSHADFLFRLLLFETGQRDKNPAINASLFLSLFDSLSPWFSFPNRKIAGSSHSLHQRKEKDQRIRFRQIPTLHLSVTSLSLSLSIASKN